MSDFTAAQALAASKKSNGPLGQSADDLNYSLTLNRLLATIKATAENDSQRHIAYVVPWFVIDGTTTNQIKLAKQLQKKLTQLGYFVRREHETLYIDWDLELHEEEKRLERERKAKIRADEIAERKRLKELQDRATGPRKRVKISDEFQGMEAPKARRVQQQKSSSGGGFSVTKKKKSK